MSVINEQRNELKKRFGNKAAVLIDDTLYSSHLLAPNGRNKRIFNVHNEAVVRLNWTMSRIIRGNAQVFYTMLWKDQPRENLISQFWNGLITTEEFKSLPKELKDLELEQAKKLGPTSRFDIKRLYDGFVNHIDENAKVKNQNLEEYREAAKYYTNYLYDVCIEAKTRQPALFAKTIANLGKVANLTALPAKKAGGDPYFSNTGGKILGVLANELYHKDARRLKTMHSGAVYFEQFIRVQPKGNNFIKSYDPNEGVDFTDGENLWLNEKNRIVQGDSRAWQFVLKPMSDVITKLLKVVDPCFVGWTDQDRKNKVIGKTLKEFAYKDLNFDSFDATDYDASTDPENFRLGIEIIWNLCHKLAPNAALPDLDWVVDHYLHDPTLTPWGAYYRDSTPSGHNFTGPNGTVTNSLRCFVQEKRRRGCSFAELVEVLKANWSSEIALFSTVGDDAFQLREISREKKSIAEENNSDGYKSSEDGSKISLSPFYIHFLQMGYYIGPDGSMILGYYPASRVMEHLLFQEEADQYTSLTVVAQAAIQNLNNARFNKCNRYLINFVLRGDTKYRLGLKYPGGFAQLYKDASEGKAVAEFLNREWDPAYAEMTWEEFSEVIAPTLGIIKEEGEKLGYI